MTALCSFTATLIEWRTVGSFGTVFQPHVSVHITYTIVTKQDPMGPSRDKSPTMSSACVLFVEKL